MIAAIGAAAYLLGWDIRGWFSELWDTLTEISAKYLIPALVLQTLQTLFTAFAWLSIIRYAYPDQELTAGARLLRGLGRAEHLPAGEPRHALMLLMFTAIIAGATFAGIFAGYLVEKIFFTLIGAFVYLYLFLSVGGSFDIKFGCVPDHPWATAILAAGGVFLISCSLRASGRRSSLVGRGEAGRRDPPSRGSTSGASSARRCSRWFASLGVMALFLAAYGIPVSFHTLMRIVGGNSIANVTSVTPGGAGVNQAFNVASLNGITDATTATAYSVAQQLVTTAWNIFFAIVAGGLGLRLDGRQGARRGARTRTRSTRRPSRRPRAAERKEAKQAAKHA